MRITSLFTVVYGDVGAAEAARLTGNRPPRTDQGRSARSGGFLPEDPVLGDHDVDVKGEIGDAVGQHEAEQALLPAE